MTVTATGVVFIAMGVFTLICVPEQWVYGAVLTCVGIVLCVIGKIALREDEED